MKNFVAFILSFLTSFFHKVLEPTIKFVNVIKEAVNNPSLDIAVSLTATTLDDKILEALRKALPSIVSKLNYLSNVEGCLELTDLNEIAACLVRMINEIPLEWRDDAYRHIAIEIARQTEMSEESKRDINLAVEAAYHRIVRQAHDGEDS